ncbi:Uma2 family endonuclease [Azospirillum sp. SYSU D00513]|uniref:Uma2 family endonuclease n=1 Tax=Azospirillum sp. SYSU D00513 TaxID=2812561 RepID=UPI001A9769C2|nr:Uma2 family endonuclease [Azospirillum sp. SYSU D00513]
MGEPPRQDWPLPDFLAWEERQAERYELLDGRPVMMTGGTQAHALIAANLIASLRPLLRGGPCRPGGSDLRVPMPGTGNSRYPDVTIDCGPFDRTSHDATEPAVVFEVLSKSTRWYDQTTKLRDYDSVPSIRQYVCVSQDEPRVSVWTRGAEGRLLPRDDVTAGAVALEIAGHAVTLPLTDIYEGTGLLEAQTMPLTPPA